MGKSDYAEWRPPANLSSVVDSVWTRSVPRPRNESILPDGCMDVIWNGRVLLVAGPDTKPHPVRQDGPFVAVAVRFLPGMAPAFLGVPADALRDGRVPLQEVWSGSRARRLEERLHATTGLPQVRRVLAEEVTRRPITGVDWLAPKVVHLANCSNDVAAMAERLGLSERQLRRRCLAMFGYGPKVLHRVLRFRRAVELARSGTMFTDVAYETGYSDQAHLSREVKSLAGVPLRALLADA